MKTLSAKAKISGLTLIEVLVVLAVLFILAALLLPALARSKSSRGIQCLSNQKQIALGFIIWNGDNNGRFPWQVSTTNGGAMELVSDGHPSSQFRVTLDYIKSYYVWICPTDPSHHMATNNATFGDLNTSYFVNVDATTNNASNILTGDRNLLANDRPVKPGLFTFTNNTIMGWTRELHGKHGKYPIGFMGFADGRVEGEWDKDSDLTSLFQQQRLVTDRLAVP